MHVARCRDSSWVFFLEKSAYRPTYQNLTDSIVRHPLKTLCLRPCSSYASNVSECSQSPGGSSSLIWQRMQRVCDQHQLLIVVLVIVGASREELDNCMISRK